MNKIKFQFLDIPIIRSCNLGCGGCLTFSDSKRIKGTVKLEESREWLSYWATKLLPDAVTVFGGEPLLHPDFVNWCKALREYWPQSELRINTNGYYLDKILDKIPELFTEQTKPQFIVSIQTGHEPYYSIVRKNIDIVKDAVLTHFKSLYPHKKIVWNLWLDEPEIYKQWWRLEIDGVDTQIRITACEQFRIYWQAHYQGFENSLEPFYDYDDTIAAENHQSCQAKDFVNLYKGKIYKCPTTAVLEHTLETFNLTQNENWIPYLTKYSPLTVDSTDSEIASWFERQKTPENVCNMCGFAGPKWTSGHLNRHELKEGWKYQTIMINT